MSSLTCVIGGNGFLGHALVERLIQSGRNVRVLGRSLTHQIPVSGCVGYFSGNYGHLEVLERFLDSANEVVDLAYSTVPKTSFEDPAFDIMTNLPQAVQLYQYLSTTTIKKLVVVSSGGTVYGKADYFPIDEIHPTQPISPYGITKLAIEKYASMYYQLYNLPVICARPSNAYGEGQVANRGQGFISTAIGTTLEKGTIQIYGANGTVRDYVHVRDIAAAIEALLDNGKAGEVYNIGTGIGHSNLGIVNIIRSCAEQAGFSVEVTNTEARKYDVAINILDCAKIRKDTGWEPRTVLKEGIQNMWEYSLRKHRGVEL